MTATDVTKAGDFSDLQSLGYKQELKRGLGPFASFCSGFSFVSILTTVFNCSRSGLGLAVQPTFGRGRWCFRASSRWLSSLPSCPLNTRSRVRFINGLGGCPMTHSGGWQGG